MFIEQIMEADMGNIGEFLLMSTLQLIFSVFTAEYVLCCFLQIVFRKQKIIENHNIIVDIFITIALLLMTIYLYWEYPIM